MAIINLGLSGVLVMVASISCAPRDEQLRPARNSGGTCTRNCTPPEFKPLASKAQQGIVDATIAHAELLAMHLNIAASESFAAAYATSSGSSGSKSCQIANRSEPLRGMIQTVSGRTKCKMKNSVWDVEESIVIQGLHIFSDSQADDGIARDASVTTQEALAYMGNRLPAQIELRSVDADSKLRPLKNLKDRLDVRGSRFVSARLISVQNGIFRYQIRAEFFLSYFMDLKDFTDEGRVSGQIENTVIELQYTPAGFRIVQMEITPAAETQPKTTFKHFSNRRVKNDSRSSARFNDLMFNESLLIGADRFGKPGSLYGYFAEVLL